MYNSIVCGTMQTGIYKKRLKIPKGGNQNQYIEEEQTTQWPKEKKCKKDGQRSTKHIHRTKDQVTRTPLKTGGESRVKHYNHEIYSLCRKI